MAKLNDNALKLLEKRYYLRDSKTGKIIEHSPEDLFSRVAKYIASAEKEKELQDKWTKEFFDVMNNQLFMPNTPTLVNAGKDKCLSACSVIGRYPDSLEGIYKYLWYNAKLTKYGCGVGQDLSNIRPKGEIIKTSGGKSAGVINWMHNIQTTAATTIQGDTARRAANMVSLRFNHPDIEEFIDAKKENSQLFSAMNISVIIKDEEFKKALNGEEIWLQWNKKKYKKVNAKTLLDKIFTNAWSNGEPGLIFLDRMNEGNPFNLLDDTFNETNKHYIITTNPCGEQPLEQWELCVLGSINLENIYNETKNNVDYSLLKRTIETSIRFLDNSITVNEFVLPEFKDKVLSNRKIGLGVTGFAHLLIKLGIQYDSDEALKFIDKLFKFIQQTAEDVDEILAKEKGVFPSWKDSIFSKKNIKRRNATITTQAPTGSISTILGTESYGIEPLFSIGYIRRIVDGEILEINKLFKQKLHQVINDSDKEKNIVKQCIDAGTTNLDCVPKELKKLFRCANDISPEWHIKIMAQLQKYYENAVSKTVNLPETATPEDVKNAYTLAFALNCKGITVYRNNSIEDQTIQIGNKNNDKKVPYEVVSADDLPRGFIENVPPDLTYRKYKLYTGCGTLYFFVGIDEYEGKIYDCFTNTNGVGGCVVNTQANSRLLSTAIRYGAPIEYLIEQLQKAGTCPSYQYKRGLQNGVNHILHMSLNKFNTNDIKDKELREEIEEYTGQPLSKGKSCSSAIANILKNILDEFKNTEYIKNEKEDFKISIRTNPIKSDMGKCPVCGEPIILAEGCKSCPSCGWSKCN